MKRVRAQSEPSVNERKCTSTNEGKRFVWYQARRYIWPLPPPNICIRPQNDVSLSFLTSHKLWFCRYIYILIPFETIQKNFLIYICVYTYIFMLIEIYTYALVKVKISRQGKRERFTKVLPLKRILTTIEKTRVNYERR